MRTVDDFMDYIAPYIPDAPEPLVQFNIQEAITDFMLQTKVAKNFVRFDVFSNVNDYALEIPECEILIDIKSVRMGDPTSCQSSQWDKLELTHEQMPYGYYADLDSAGEPAIWIGNPCDDAVVEVEYSWAVGRGGCLIPDFIYNKYARTIQNLALSRLYLLAGQEWANAQLASAYLTEYNNEVNNIVRKSRKLPSGKLVAPPLVGRRFDPTRGFFRR